MFSHKNVKKELPKKQCFFYLKCRLRQTMFFPRPFAVEGAPEKSIPSKVKILSLKTFDCLEIVVWKGVLTAHW